MLRPALSIVLIAFFYSLNAQSVCPSKKDTITPGMLETMFPIDNSLINYKTYYLDKDYKSTKNPAKYRYKYLVPEYNGSGASLFKLRLSKIRGHCPKINNLNDSLIDGELIYRAKGSYFHLSFNKGVLWGISEEGRRYEEWRSYTDLSLLFGESPKWIRKEIYDLDGMVESIVYWYSCGDEVKMQSWKL